MNRKIRNSGPRDLRRLMRVLAFVLPALFLCAQSIAGTPEPAVSPQKMVWPPAPEQARIVYRHSFSKASDLGWGRSWWRKVVDWMMNETDPSTLSKPYEVAFDDNWRMIVADIGAHEIKIFDPAKHSVKRIRGYKKKMFGMPVAVAVDDDQNIYVADSAAGRVLKYSAQGKLLAFIGGEEGAFKRPAGLAFDRRRGELFVVDTVRPKIFVYAKDGTLLRQFGRRGNGPGEFNFPTFIASDRDGQLYVNDTLNFRVQVLSPKGDFVREFGALGNGSGDMSRSKGVAVDSEKNIYVADAMFSTVQIFDREGRFLLNFGTEGQSAAEFYMPAGITIDRFDYVYVADPFHGRVEVFHHVAPRAGQAPAAGGLN